MGEKIEGRGGKRLMTNSWVFVFVFVCFALQEVDVICSVGVFSNNLKGGEGPTGRRRIHFNHEVGFFRTFVYFRAE